MGWWSKRVCVRYALLFYLEVKASKAKQSKGDSVELGKERNSSGDSQSLQARAAKPSKEIDAF